MADKIIEHDEEQSIALQRHLRWVLCIHGIPVVLRALGQIALDYSESAVSDEEWEAIASILGEAGEKINQVLRSKKL